MRAPLRMATATVAAVPNIRRPGGASADHTIYRAVCELTDAIASETGLPSSAGVATCIPVAKVASGLAKPRGVLLVGAGQEADLLAPLPVRLRARPSGATSKIPVFS